MKLTRVLLALSVLSLSQGYGQSIFMKLYGGPENEEARSIAETMDGGFIVAGQTSSYGLSIGGVTRDAYLIKLDEEGNTEWMRHYGEDWPDQFWKVRQTPDSGFIAVGTTYSWNQNPGGSYLMVKVDKLGEPQWTRIFGFPGQDDAYDVHPTADGGYLMSGLTNSYGAGNYDFYLFKSDSTGAAHWGKAFGGQYHEHGRESIVTVDGSYVMSGTSNSFLSSGNFLISKTDPSGNELWTRAYDLIGTENANTSMIETSDFGYLVAGGTNTISQNSAAWLMKTDSSGQTQWIHSFRDTTYEFTEGLEVAELNNGNFVIVGRAGSYTNSTNDMIAITVDNSGNLVEALTVDVTADDQLFGVTATHDGGYAAVGRVSSIASGVQDIIVLKALPGGITCQGGAVQSVNVATANIVEVSYNAPSSLVTTTEQWLWQPILTTIPHGIGGTDSVLCDSMVALNVASHSSPDLLVYPNPTSGQIMIDLEGVSQVFAYNMTGALVGEFRTSGQLDISHFPAGIYVLKVVADDRLRTVKVVKE